MEYIKSIPLLVTNEIRLQILSHNIVSSTPHLSGIQTHNFSGDTHRLHRLLDLQFTYDHDHDGPLQFVSYDYSLYKFCTSYKTSFFCQL